MFSVVVFHRLSILNPSTNFQHTQRGGLGLKQITAKLTGHESFEVDESFVFEQMTNEISEDEQEAMNLFVDQSITAQQEKVEEEEERRPVRGFYRICDVPTKQCDDSPLESIEHPDRITSRKNSVFGHKGKMIHTDGKKDTKLTKIYKRGDNSGTFLKALKRMGLSA
jgi:hypothetical protein